MKTIQAKEKTVMCYQMQSMKIDTTLAYARMAGENK
jgi:hypothetical protein